jgi:hypothetical protein
VLKWDIGCEAKSERNSGAGLLEMQGWNHDLRLGLERFRRVAALLDSAKPGFDPLGELRAARPLNPFHHLFHAAVGPNAKANGVLGHHEINRGCQQ